MLDNVETAKLYGRPAGWPHQPSKGGKE